MAFRIHDDEEGKEYRAAVLPEYNFCKKSSVEGLRAWLLAPAASLEQPTPDNMAGAFIAMTSYYAFARAFKHMSDDEKTMALSNIHVRADESHHVAMGEEESEYDRNKVGSILKLLMDNQHNGSGITLSTATNFRSDNKCIVRPEMLSKFKHYRLSFLDHFKNTGIKTYVQMQAGKWKDAVETLKVLLDTRGTFMMGESPALLIPLAERDLGSCERHLGNLSEAARHFSVVKAIWSRADTGLKNTIAQAEIPSKAQDRDRK